MPRAAVPGVIFGIERPLSFGRVEPEHVLAAHLAVDLEADLLERARRLAAAIERTRGRA